MLYITARRKSKPFTRGTHKQLFVLVFLRKQPEMGFRSLMYACSNLDVPNAQIQDVPRQIHAYQNILFVYRHFNYIYSAESFND